MWGRGGLGLRGTPGWSGCRMREGSGTPLLVDGVESGRGCSGMGSILRDGGVGGVGARGRWHDDGDGAKVTVARNCAPETAWRFLM